MTLLQAIRAAAKIAANAAYDGRVIIYKYKGRIGIEEFKDHYSFNPEVQEIYSMNTSPYERETQKALVNEARKILKV